MFTFTRDGNVFFLTEWRLCCMCCRLINRNRDSHIIGKKGEMILFQHVVCPPERPQPKEPLCLKP